ncbi:DNA polymerase IV [Vibrio sp. 10N.261.46.E12]|uniref:DNA polymerase IV n=1 Tax=unclassified Vibrio TaxID=2614977 RepID=UPI00097708E4|nr:MULTISPECIES: DNA polymerase IV [unclassified Vibrio]OMO35361.1 DNA polymerase IV [Vibrio sp. 10N.261.45.E1]PMJ25466.1 DNA polymerase IV [Vibrio sp. 10N.286.45.B6]PML88917.1 DNA polymerase IV [Vibrio sp. 10N.261.49.E11]PMM64936.1 DNA polymerase IV [Vibrio sp. 10N.261.46.F12]PMM81318.1 DNA polymerase IV [Vibrio sp. 10N.261.46.E8]
MCSMGEEKVRKIIHVDMDCFYAAVEMRDNLSYRNRPLAVGGHEKQRGVLSTCNYEARKFGVRSAMPTGKALQLCPNLLVVPGRMSVYVEISKKIREIFARYTSIIEPLSLDEAFLDVTDSKQCHGSATLIAESIRRDIWNELNLTASAGIAPIKFLAKVASDLNKPNGQFVIPPQDVQSVIDELPLEKIPGVGKVSIEKLHQAGFFTCKDIKESDYRDLLLKFGRQGASLWKRSHGVDDREVIIERERKSVGVERTFTQNISTYAECWQVIEDKLFPELETRLEKASPSKAIIKQGIKLKFADFQQTTIEHIHASLDREHFKELLSEILKRQQGREIRLLGLSVMLQPKDQMRQLSFF